MATTTITRLFVGGEWQDAEGGATLGASSPATGEPLGDVAQAGPADADRAVGAAKAAFRGWAAATAFERADALRRCLPRRRLCLREATRRWRRCRLHASCSVVAHAAFSCSLSGRPPARAIASHPHRTGAV